MSRDSTVMTACAGLTALVLLLDAVVSVASGAYLNLGSGVWLAMGLDIAHGLFYRPLWHGGEYGGTRYFPMLPLATAALVRLQVPVVAAGLTVSIAGLLALAASVAVLLKRLRVPSPLVALGSALAVAPYFVHQTAFAVRSEPLSAAFGIAGLALLARDPGAGSAKRQAAAAALFVCAFATKMTGIYAPAAAAAALLLDGRGRAAVRLLLLTAAGALLFLGAMNLASDGRALESFRANALAGSTWGSFLSPTLMTRPLMLIGTSRLLTAVFLLSAAALIAHPRQWPRLPGLLLLSAAAITAVIFTSPGTILTSQIVDAYVAAIVFLTVVVAGYRGKLRTVGLAVLASLAVWAAGQNVVRVAGMVADDRIRTASREHRELMATLERCRGSILSESPLVPVLAGERPVLLDPFAFHVLARDRPDISKDLVDRVSRREFACVVLEQDPTTPRGRAWYRNVNLGEPVVDAVLRNYTFDRVIANQRLYFALELSRPASAALRPAPGERDVRALLPNRDRPAAALR